MIAVKRVNGLLQHRVLPTVAETFARLRTTCRRWRSRFCRAAATSDHGRVAGIGLGGNAACPLWTILGEAVRSRQVTGRTCRGSRSCGWSRTLGTRSRASRTPSVLSTSESEPRTSSAGDGYLGGGLAQPLFRDQPPGLVRCFRVRRSCSGPGPAPAGVGTVSLTMAFIQRPA
jgi:hypothetical protein